MTIMQGIVNDWNEKCPVGTLVEYDRHDGSKKITRTKSLAVAAGHCAMIELEGVAGRMHLGCCRTLPREYIESEIVELSFVATDQNGGIQHCFKDEAGKVVSPLTNDMNTLFELADKLGFKVRWVRRMPVSIVA